MKRVDVVMTAEEYEKCRSAAFHLPGHSISSLCREGALAIIARIEAERGSPFPPLPPDTDLRKRRSGAPTSGERPADPKRDETADPKS